MKKQSIPDYSKYSAHELMDMYVNMDKLQEPANASAIEEAMRLKINDSTVTEQLKNPGYKWERKKIWLTILTTVLFILMIMPRFFYTPDISTAQSFMIFSAVVNISLISILILWASMGKSIFAGFLLVLYFFYILFGPFIF